jgi:hypothetical protein
MADRNTRINAVRQYYALSGRDNSPKRKLSEDNEESIEKRGKKSSEDTVSISISDTRPNELHQAKMDTTQLAKIIKQVMLDDETTDALVKKLRVACDEKIEKETKVIKEDVEKLKEEQEAQKVNAESMDTRIDELEQDKRQDNLLVRGIRTSGNNLRQACLTTLNKELKIHLKTADMKYVTPIGKKEDMAKIAFIDSKTREEVYKSRTKLKGKNLWITEDLTPKKAALFYKARQAVKNEAAVLTWTYNGKIFLKTSSTAKPKLIKTADDLPDPPTQDSSDSKSDSE